MILLGPPFVVTDDELARISDVVAEAVEAAVATVV
jgi:adenosylmethionine-8-amino-7-oxononanoate aminotransferase